ncbi:MAG: hypothetical protein AAGE13_09275, partial [Pseudomonadota bacterium]
MDGSYSARQASAKAAASIAGSCPNAVATAARTPLHAENLDQVLAARGLSGRLSAPDQAELARAWEQLPPW